MCRSLVLLSLVVVSAPVSGEKGGGKEVIQADRLGRNFGLWRLTHDPTVRDHANYHNTQCFSPDGRYICYTHWGGEHPGTKGSSTIHLFDLHTNTDRLVDRGVFPRWARRHNWLFYVAYRPRPDSLARNGSCVMWLDLDSGRHQMLVDGPEGLGETDCQDRWIIGALRFRGRQPEFEIVRIPLKPGARLEKLPGVVGAQLLPNPRHPLFFTRRDHNDDPFQATRYWYDLDGSNQRIAVPTLQKCHMCWLGNGQYLLLGNGLIRGRLWNEPFPSNVHILAAVSVGDVSPCGTSGRYVCGDSTIADLRSGDGWQYVEPLSIICYPKRVADDSGIYDADPKGSPDGTKICFVSNYPLKDGPVTHVRDFVRREATSIPVESTKGFPPSGHLNVHREVIAYTSKTPTRFEGITRAVFDTAMVNLRPGRTVTSFQARCLTEDQWAGGRHLSPPMRKSIGADHPQLLRQRQTDIYVAVVRRPDRPWLRPVAGGAELIPGESHDETRGYVLLRDGRPVAGQRLRPGSTARIDRSGSYQAVAVEWSALESEPSVAVQLQEGQTLKVCAEPPADFSWTTERWSEDKTVKELIHRYDGVIQRQWYEGDALVRQHDLNASGQATRRIQFRQGRLAVRQYYDRDGRRVSRELFDADGFVTETIRYQTDASGHEREVDHWWFERGMPVRQRRGGREYFKRGDRFGRLDSDGRFIDTPRGALSD